MPGVLEAAPLRAAAGPAYADEGGSGGRLPLVSEGRLLLPNVRLAATGSMAGYPLMPWATCPWCADSCSVFSSAALRCGLMSKVTFFMVPVNVNGARFA